MLTIADLTFRMEGRLLFEGASAFIPDGHRVGFVGRNGTGKTTLFRLIAGDLQPEGGNITRPKGARLGLVRQEAPAGPQSLLETVLAANTERLSLLQEAETASDPHRIAEIQTRLADMQAHAAPARAAEILAGLGFSHEAQQRACSEFSGGWRMRVALAAILFVEPDLLLLDEPTNYLDLEGTIWLENFLRTYPHTVLMISHDRDLLNRAVGSIMHLEQRKLSMYTGGYDTFEETRAQKLLLQEAMRKKQDVARKHMQSFVDRFRYKMSKARQAQSRLKAIERMKPIAAVIEEHVKPFILPSPEVQLAPPIIAMEGVDVGYGDGPSVLSHLTLRIDDDDRIALLGANGNGKSTFAKLLAQRLKPRDGKITRAPKLKVGYFAQHQLDELEPEDTPLQHLARLMPGKTETQVRARLGTFGFGADLADTEVERLSGGEKARLLFALATFDTPHLVILDEPTNHLDVDRRESLAQALNQYEGAVILISHDRHLIDACVDRLWLVGDGRVKPFDGDLDDYKRILLGQTPKPDRASVSDVVARSRADERRAAAEKRASLAPLKKRVDQAEREYTRLSAQIGDLEVKLADPSLYQDGGVKANDLMKKRGDLRRTLDAVEADWLEAQHAYEEAARATAAE
jgi:ATP-binding cassette subfamily F protein 3